nr:MAG TPA: hypothetical protein [Caudoviricetes sp.]
MMCGRFSFSSFVVRSLSLASAASGRMGVQGGQNHDVTL